MITGNAIAAAGTFLNVRVGVTDPTINDASIGSVVCADLITQASTTWVGTWVTFGTVAPDTNLVRTFAIDFAAAT